MVYLCSWCVQEWLDLILAPNSMDPDPLGESVFGICHQSFPSLTVRDSISPNTHYVILIRFFTSLCYYSFSCLCTWMYLTTFCLQFCSYPLHMFSFRWFHLPLGSILDFCPKLNLRYDIWPSTWDKSFTAHSPVAPQLSFDLSWIYSLDLCFDLGFFGNSHPWIHIPEIIYFFPFIITTIPNYQLTFTEYLPTSRHGVKHLIFIISLSLSKISEK